MLVPLHAGSTPAPGMGGLTQPEASASWLTTSRPRGLPAHQRQNPVSMFLGCSVLACEGGCRACSTRPASPSPCLRRLPRHRRGEAGEGDGRQDRRVRSRSSRHSLRQPVRSLPRLLVSARIFRSGDWCSWGIAQGETDTILCTPACASCSAVLKNHTHTRTAEHDLIMHF